MIVLGVDAAATSGWALVRAAGPGDRKPTLLTYGVVRAADHVAVGRVALCAAETGAELALLESPFVAKNPDTTIKLALVVGRFAQECDRAGLPWQLFKASEWQRQLLAGLITQVSRREQRKAAAKLWVKSVYGVVVSEDEADAICLATMGAKTAVYAARVAVGAVSRPTGRARASRQGGAPTSRRRGQRL